MNVVDTFSGQKVGGRSLSNTKIVKRSLLEVSTRNAASLKNENEVIEKQVEDKVLGGSWKLFAVRLAIVSRNGAGITQNACIENLFII